MAGTPHPALEFHQHQLVGAIDQGQLVHGAVPLAAMVQGEVELLPAQAADLRIAAHHHIEGGAEPGHPAP